MSLIKKSGLRPSLVISSCLLALSMCYMLFIFAPAELYLVNHSDMWFDIYTLGSVMGAVFSAGLILNILILLSAGIFSEKIFKILYSFEFVCLICFYIHGNFFVKSLPSLDGHYIDWNGFGLQKAVSLVIIAVLIIITLAVCIKSSFDSFNKISAGICGALLLLLVVTLFVEIFTAGDRNRLLQHKTTVSFTVKNEMLYSKDTNYIILLLDKLDSAELEYFAGLSPEYTDILDGFTYYRDAMGVFPRTKFAIPLILTGERYENKGYFEDYYINALESSPILKEAEKRDFVTGMYETTDNIRLGADDGRRFDNVVDEPLMLTSRKAFAFLIMRLVMFKYAPFILKGAFDAESIDLKSVRDSHCEYELFGWSDKAFYELLRSGEPELTDSRVFKYIHLEGAHSPFDIRGDMSAVADGEGSYEDKAEASLTVIEEFVSMLKEAGMYDNSVLIILADHGDQDGDAAVPHGTHGQNPLLLIKGRNEHHKMKTSLAPVYYMELQKAMIRLMEGRKGDEVFDVKEGDDPERLFYYYGIKDEKNMYEYRQSGRANDDNGFVETGNVYSWEP